MGRDRSRSNSRLNTYILYEIIKKGNLILQLNLHFFIYFFRESKFSSVIFNIMFLFCVRSLTRKYYTKKKVFFFNFHIGYFVFPTVIGQTYRTAYEWTTHLVLWYTTTIVFYFCFLQSKLTCLFVYFFFSYTLLSQNIPGICFPISFQKLKS